MLPQHIQKQLKEILFETGQLNSFPRNIVVICNKLGILVQETHQFDDNISGLIYKENENYYILVNAKHHPKRKAFTIAHELGHYFLHKDKLDTNSEIISYIKSARDNVPALARTNMALSDTNYNKMERDANDFAADILMPAQQFMEQCVNSDSIEEVASHFGVSVSAASIRAENLGGIFFL